MARPAFEDIRVITVNDYDDTYAETEGEWRFTSRAIHPRLIGDKSQHRADLRR